MAPELIARASQHPPPPPTIDRPEGTFHTQAPTLWKGVFFPHRSTDGISPRTLEAPYSTLRHAHRHHGEIPRRRSFLRSPRVCSSTHPQALLRLCFLIKKRASISGLWINAPSAVLQPPGEPRQEPSPDELHDHASEPAQRTGRRFREHSVQDDAPGALEHPVRSEGRRGLDERHGSRRRGAGEGARRREGAR